MTDTIEAATATSDDRLKEDVIQVLESILADARFASAPQMSAFLNYVVRKTLAGEAERIKAYTVGVDALGKPETFDPQNDPSVRVLAKRLRTFLDEYNLRTATAPLYIEIRPGSYRPLFLTRPEHGVTKTEAQVVGSTNTELPMSTKGSAIEHSFECSATTHSKTAHASNDPAVSKHSREADISSAVDNIQPSPLALSDAAPSTSRRVWSVRSLTLAVVAAGLILALSQVGNLGSEPTETLTASLGSSVRSPADVDAGQLGAALPMPRPTRPQIEVLGFHTDQAALDAQIATLLSSAVLKAGELDVLRGSGDSQTIQGWPERYILSLHTVPMNEQSVSLEVQLVNASDKRLTHASSIRLSTTEEGYLDATAVETINTFANSLSHEDGPLLSDYIKHYAADTVETYAAGQ